MENSKKQDSSKLKGFFMKCDIFSSTQFLRLKQESSYTTVTGGICTLIFLLIVIIIFSLTLRDTLNKGPTVTSTSSQYGITTPLSIKTSTQDRSKFMFAISVQDQQRNIYDNNFFDISLNLIVDVNGTLIHQRIELQRCNQSQWNINSQISDQVNSSRLNQRYICPPKDTIIYLYGSVNTPGFNGADIVIRPFYDQNYWDRYYRYRNTQFIIKFAFINTFINPGEKDPLAYFLDDRNYMYFGIDNGGIIALPLSKYEIQTTNNKIPFISQKLQRESGSFVEEPVKFISTPAGVPGVMISLKRSVKDMKFQRTYASILDVISYIGGLVSIFLPFIKILINSYNSFVFQLKTSQQIFSIRKEQPKTDEVKISTINQKVPSPISDNPQDIYIQQQKTNLFTFIKNKLCCKNKYIIRFQKQINVQLDIQNIIKKLYKMQRFIKLMKEKFKDDENIDLNVLQKRAILLIDDNDISNQQKPRSSVNLYQGPLEINLNPYNQENTSRDSGRQNHGQDQKNGQNKGKKSQIYSQMNKDNLQSRDMINNEMIEI